MAQNGVNVTFQVRDASGRNINTSTSVNVVPYISEVETPLSKAYSSASSAFNRSALGGYPVREGDSITIRGFNLGANATNANNTTINGTALTSGSVNTDTYRVTTITGTVPTGNTYTSGELNVTVNSIQSFNNRSNKSKTGDFFNSPYVFTAPYNWEPNNVNNNILNNSRYIYVWQANYIDNTSTATVYNPFMRITSGGVRLLSYGYYPSSGNGVLRVNRNGTNIATATANTNRMTNTTITACTNASWYAIGSDITAGNYPFRFARSTDVGTGYQASINLVDPIGPNSNRFKIPRIATQATAGATVTNNKTTTIGSGTRTDNLADRVLISYYDETNNNINVIYGNIGATGNTGNIPGTPYTVAGGSMYTAVGFLTNGLPLLAYYDNATDRLLLRWGNETPSVYNTNQFPYGQGTSRVTTWRDPVVIDTNKGAHVDMAVDPNDNIHLAYNDINNGGLYYLLIPPTPTGTTGANIADRRPDTSNLRPIKVDTFLSAGTKIMINVRSDGTRYVPYISYVHASFKETKNSVRVAWRTDFTNYTQPLAGTDGNNTFSGKWEVMTVPVNAVPNADEFICNGVPGTGYTWSTTGISTNLNYTTNLNQTIIVGYMTNSWYEGAILKGNILSVPVPLQK